MSHWLTKHTFSLIVFCYTVYQFEQNCTPKQKQSNTWRIKFHVIPQHVYIVSDAAHSNKSRRNYYHIFLTYVKAADSTSWGVARGTKTDNAPWWEPLWRCGITHQHHIAVLFELHSEEYAVPFELYTTHHLSHILRNSRILKLIHKYS